MLVPGGAYSGKKLQDAAGATGNGEEVTCTGNPNGGLSTVSLYVAISNTATVTFEATIDGTNWVAIQGTNLNTGAAASTATATGMFRFTVLGLLKFRARVSAWTSGTVTVHALAVA